MSSAELRLLVPVLGTRHAGAVLAIAGSILKARGGSGSLLGVVEVARGEPISKGMAVARRYRRLLNRITEIEAETGAGFGVEVRVAHNATQGVQEAVYERRAELVALEWPAAGLRRGARQVIANLVADPPADLLLVRPDPEQAGGPLRRVLVPVRGGPSARLALLAAGAIASAQGAEMTVMHVYRPGLPEARRRREAPQGADKGHLICSRNVSTGGPTQ